jgi:hypothetical protein
MDRTRCLLAASQSGLIVHNPHLDTENRKESYVESQPLSKASRSQMTAPGIRHPSTGNLASSRPVEAAADLEYPFMQ